MTGKRDPKGDPERFISDPETATAVAEDEAEKMRVDALVRAMKFFIQQEEQIERSTGSETLEDLERVYEELAILRRGITFFAMKEYRLAMEAFEEAADKESYRGVFLLGLIMTETNGFDYFEGLDHMIEAANEMMLPHYLDLLSKTLEKGEYLKLIEHEKIPFQEKRKQTEIREIAIALALPRDMDSSDPQKKITLAKLLRLLRNYRMN